MRQRARRDDNHREIVLGLRDAGAMVLDLGAVGNGCPDVLVGFRGAMYLLEIKDGRKAPSARKLTEDEAKFHADWQGYEVHMVINILDAMRKIGAVTA